VKDQFKKESFVRELGPGMLFGEVALLFRTRRTASIKSKDQCTIGALNEDNFLELVRTFPEVENSLRLESRNYNDHWKNYQIHIISRIHYLQNLPYSIREELHYRFTL
jgi:Cyclic nucleotide-binding domain